MLSCLWDDAYKRTLAADRFRTICGMPYNHKYNVLSESLNKTFPSFHSPSKQFDMLTSMVGVVAGRFWLHHSEI